MPIYAGAAVILHAVFQAKPGTLHSSRSDQSENGSTRSFTVARVEGEGLDRNLHVLTILKTSKCSLRSSRGFSVLATTLKQPFAGLWVSAVEFGSTFQRKNFAEPLADKKFSLQDLS